MSVFIKWLFDVQHRQKRKTGVFGGPFHVRTNRDEAVYTEKGLVTR